MRRIGLGMVAAMLAAGAQANLFSRAEVERVQEYWATPERYQVGDPPNVRTHGRWQVRLTPEGSRWLHALGRLRNGGEKLAPTQDFTGRNDEERRWVNARVAYDRYIASLDAAAANGAEKVAVLPTPALVPEPGEMPGSLRDALGEPPAFAEAVTPRGHLIAFHDGQVVRYVDNPDMRPKYAYYRFREGVMDGGTPMRRLTGTETEKVLEDAGISGFERRVFEAVSLLEGGFDSVNTYDTGFVSVGFIQFASLSAGAGSLGQVLLTQKRRFPESFQRDFADLGVDVRPDGRLVALDLDEGRELTGPEANLQIIRDKRLIAVFHRAGRVSHPNRVSQVMVAKSMYYPANDEVVVPHATGLKVFRLGDFIKSEAGMATLMDRKVNTGRLGAIGDVVSQVMRARNLNQVDELVPFEAEIIRRMRYRKDYMADPKLSQPPAIPTQ